MWERVGRQVVGGESEHSKLCREGESPAYVIPHEVAVEIAQLHQGTHGSSPACNVCDYPSRAAMTLHSFSVTTMLCSCWCLRFMVVICKQTSKQVDISARRFSHMVEYPVHMTIHRVLIQALRIRQGAAFFLEHLTHCMSTGRLSFARLSCCSE